METRQEKIERKTFLLGDRSKWRITDTAVYTAARKAGYPLPFASGSIIDITAAQHEQLNLTDFSTGVSYVSRQIPKRFFFLEFQGEIFAERIDHYLSQRSPHWEYWNL